MQVALCERHMGCLVIARVVTSGHGERRRKTMAKIEEKELEGHREEIIADVKKLVEKYRAIFDWDVPDIDQAAADKLILMEVRGALNELEHKLLG
jgi:hypothetical protein